MASKRALVVDDSRLARLSLCQMLKNYDLEVDTADSAEDALEYLGRAQPDVIFMDHMMPGMDGLEAVKVIKDNPKTAMIPIMMYTSKEGEVYVSQARALGAVGVLPKQVEKAELDEVLQSLRIIGEQEEQGRTAPGVLPAAAEVPGSAANDYIELRDVARDVAARLDPAPALDDIQRIIEQEHDKLKDEVQESVQRAVLRYDAERSAIANRRFFVRFALISAALIALPLWYVHLFTQAEEARQRSLSEYEQLLKTTLAQKREESVGARDDITPAASDERTADTAVVRSLDWALNTSNGFAYGETPLDGARLGILRELLQHLAQLNYRGRVVLNVHNGNYCLVRSETDVLTLAKPTDPLERCDAEARADEYPLNLEESQSLAFANFLRTSPVLGEGYIEVDIVLSGTSRPLVPYPQASATPSAGDWNTIAALNNRVEFRLSTPQ
ncbi:MAG: response regulator [Pseudomonadota bacterium]|nr:MAG: response regulator [Pseudomonadota bacterium]